MEIVTLLLAFILIAKIAAITQAIFWIRDKGREHTEFVKANLKEQGTLSGQTCATSSVFVASFEATDGVRVLPFGVKDFMLLRCENNESKRINRFVARITRNYIFHGATLMWVTTGWVFFVTAFPVVEQGKLIKPEYHLLALYFLSLLPIWSVLLLTVEAIYAYGKMRSYAWAFHMNPRSENVFFDELRPFIRLVVRVIMSGATASYISTIVFQGLTGKALVKATMGDIVSCFKLFLQCIYFVLTTIVTVGYGDISPNNGWGQLVAFLIMMCGFSLITLVLASIAVHSSGPSK